MSKSAIKALNKAQEIIAVAGVNVNLVGYVTDSNVRKSWRNADALAALVINSAANAFQCENSETFEENIFADMAEAVERYISSNLDDWNGKSWVNKDTAAELARLAEMVERNVAFEQREAAHAEALEVNEAVDQAVNIATCFANLDSATPNAINRATDHIRSFLLGLNRYNARFIVKMMISVSRQAKEARKAAAVRYQEMLARCAASGEGCNEIPF